MAWRNSSNFVILIRKDETASDRRSVIGPISDVLATIPANIPGVAPLL